jgi:hypothetical protein
MAIDPQKYVVFKRKDIPKLMEKYDLKELELPDAVVLRLSDVHAAGALYSYASSLLASFEILSQLETKHTSESLRETMANLWEVHTYFTTLAEEARRVGYKNPTP